MENLSVSQSGKAPNYHSYYREMKLSLNAVIIEKSFKKNSQSDDDNDVGINDLSKGLSITAQNIIDKINELLKAKLPNGVQSLKPEEVTPDATAERIVSGVTAFFDAYARQNPDLEGEELIASFMKEIRSGVDKGYEEAFNILEGLGAFEFDGVKDGVQQTKALIESKLQAWESAKRKELGLETQDTAPQVSSEVSSDLLVQAANQVSVYA